LNGFIAGWSSPLGSPTARQAVKEPGGAFPANFDAGWSSPVARQAHNLKVVGSNPAPAPKSFDGLAYAGLFCVLAGRGKHPYSEEC
jgi:hypothetical protein